MLDEPISPTANVLTFQQKTNKQKRGGPKPETDRLELRCKPLLPARARLTSLLAPKVMAALSSCAQENDIIMMSVSKIFDQIFLFYLDVESHWDLVGSDELDPYE